MFSIALCFVFALRCILRVVFSVVSSLLASSALLHPYLKCVHSAAPVYSSRVQLCARVRPYFAVWLVECLVAGLFGIASVSYTHLTLPTTPYV